MSLDKSLDDIISSSRKSIKSRRATRVGKVAKSGKSVGSASKKPIVSFKKSTPVPKTAQVDLSYATKVVVSGLPKDIRADAIKVCAWARDVKASFEDEERQKSEKAESRKQKAEKGVPDQH